LIWKKNILVHWNLIVSISLMLCDFWNVQFQIVLNLSFGFYDNIMILSLKVRERGFATSHTILVFRAKLHVNLNARDLWFVLSVTEAAVAAAISSIRSKCRFPNDDMQKGAADADWLATNFVPISFAR